MGYKKNDKCIQKAFDDERLFVLMTRDATAPRLVIEWIKENLDKQPEAKLREAFECALEMQRRGPEIRERKMFPMGYMDKPQLLLFDISVQGCGFDDAYELLTQSGIYYRISGSEKLKDSLDYAKEMGFNYILIRDGSNNDDFILRSSDLESNFVNFRCTVGTALDFILKAQNPQSESEG